MKLLLSVGLVLSAVFFQDWVVQKIDDRVSISFPFKPVKEILQGEPFYTANSLSGFNCTVMATDYSKQQIDSNNLAQYYATPAALKSTEESLLNDFKGSKLINSKSQTISGHVTYDITMTTGRKTADGHHDMMDYRAIVVGDKLYSLYFYYDQNKPMQETRDKFYNSFTAK